MEILIALLSSVLVVCVIVLLRLIFSRTSSNELLDTNDETNFLNKVFKEQTEVIAHKLGISLDKYLLQCDIIGIKPNTDRLIAFRLIGLLILLLGVLSGLIISNTLIILVSVITAVIFIYGPTYKINKETAKIKSQFQNELPRFLDLLQTALKLNLPVITAIKITAQNIDGILSKELINSMTQAELNNISWEDALYDLATKYEIDDFSEFVMEIVNAYDKGSDVVMAVNRKSREIKQTNLYRAKEKANKTTSSIIIPVMLFKMLPLFAILFIPIIIQMIEKF